MSSSPAPEPELHGTGRYLSALELRAWTNFLDASRLIEQALARHLSEDHGMSHREYEILVRLDGVGGQMRLATLADQCVSSRSRLTHALDRVQERGWIRRETVPDDGRGIMAVLTAAGSTQLAKASDEHARLIRTHLLDPLTEAELPVIAETMSRISQGIRQPHDE